MCWNCRPSFKPTTGVNHQQKGGVKSPIPRLWKTHDFSRVWWWTAGNLGALQGDGIAHHLVHHLHKLIRSFLVKLRNQLREHCSWYLPMKHPNQTSPWHIAILFRNPQSSPVRPSKSWVWPVLPAWNPPPSGKRNWLPWPWSRCEHFWWKKALFFHPEKMLGFHLTWVFLGDSNGPFFPNGSKWWVIPEKRWVGWTRISTRITCWYAGEIIGREKWWEFWDTVGYHGDNECQRHGYNYVTNIMVYGIFWQLSISKNMVIFAGSIWEGVVLCNRNNWILEYSTLFSHISRNRLRNSISS